MVDLQGLTWLGPAGGSRLLSDRRTMGQFQAVVKEAPREAHQRLLTFLNAPYVISW
jgi:hypothetical protein